MNIRFIGTNTMAFLCGLLIMFLVVRFALKCPNTECPACPECPVCESKEEFARIRGKKEANDNKNNFWTLSQVLQHMYDDTNNGYWPQPENLDRVNRSYIRATEYNTRFGGPDGVSIERRWAS